MASRTGTCECGACHFTMTGEPNSTWACHCTECQTRSGSVCALTVVAPVESIAMTGEVTKHAYESGGFDYRCAKCGSSIVGEHPGFPGLSFLRGGLFDDTSWLRPMAHMWTQSAQPWIQIDPRVPTYATQPTDFEELLGLWPQSRA